MVYGQSDLNEFFAAERGKSLYCVFLYLLYFMQVFARGERDDTPSLVATRISCFRWKKNSMARGPFFTCTSFLYCVANSSYLNFIHLFFSLHTGHKNLT